jgi:integrase/recombinase XerD
MPLGKQAKVLTRAQVERVLHHVEATRDPLRNRVIVLLSVKAGLRAKEIASLTWDMVADADGRVGRAIHLQDAASKGKSGRIIPLNSELQESLAALASERSSHYVVTTQRRGRTSAQAIVNLFFGWYRDAACAVAPVTAGGER